MATHGTIAAFDVNVETWTSYSERLEHYFTANDVSSADKKRAILLTVCGSATYQLLKSLIQPSKPSDKPYDELIETLTRHYSPKPSPIIQRYKFHTRNRRPSESVSTYIKAIGQYCGF